MLEREEGGRREGGIWRSERETENKDRFLVQW